MLRPCSGNIARQSLGLWLVRQSIAPSRTGPIVRQLFPQEDREWTTELDVRPMDGAIGANVARPHADVVDDVDRLVVDIGDVTDPARVNRQGGDKGLNGTFFVDRPYACQPHPGERIEGEFAVERRGILQDCNFVDTGDI